MPPHPAEQRITGDRRYRRRAACRSRTAPHRRHRRRSGPAGCGSRPAAREAHPGALVQHVRPSERDRDLLVLGRTLPDALGEDVAAEVEQRLERAAQVRLGRRCVARAASKAAGSERGRRSMPAQHASHLRRLLHDRDGLHFARRHGAVSKKLAEAGNSTARGHRRASGSRAGSRPPRPGRRTSRSSPRTTSAASGALASGSTTRSTRETANRSSSARVSRTRCSADKPQTRASAARRYRRPSGGGRGRRSGPSACGGRADHERSDLRRRLPNTYTAVSRYRRSMSRNVVWNSVSMPASCHVDPGAGGSSRATRRSPFCGFRSPRAGAGARRLRFCG